VRPWLDDGDVRLYLGDVLEVLAELPDGSVDCVVTSPPYYGLRDYGVAGQIGLEESPDLFLEVMVRVFRGVWRVLAEHGTCWVNMGDSYAQGGGSGRSVDNGGHQAESVVIRDGYVEAFRNSPRYQGQRRSLASDLPAKNLLGMPWRLALALQADGWVLRRDVIWSKPNPMPESASDRCTTAHEYLFHLTKRPRYWYDAEAVREPLQASTIERGYTAAHLERDGGAKEQGNADPRVRMGKGWWDAAYVPPGRNLRSVWTITPEPTPEAHFATFPRELVRRAILAGCPAEVCRQCGHARARIVEAELAETDRQPAPNKGRLGIPTERAANATEWGWVPNRERTAVTVGWTDCEHRDYRRGIVLDPFVGSGTTCKVARDHGRHAVGIDLNAAYLEIAARRLAQLSLLTEGSW
jgi:DNA modification methylase